MPSAFAGITEGEIFILKRQVVTIVAVCAAVCSTPVLAGTLKNGPATALVFGGDVEDEGFGFGYQAAYELNQSFSFEFSGLWHEDESSAIARNISGLGSAPTIDFDVISLALTGRIHVEPTPNVQVFGGAGLGYYIIETENQDAQESLSDAGLAFVEADGDKEFGVHFVLGTKILLSRHWELFAEVRQVFLDSGMTVHSLSHKNAPVTAQREDLSYDHRMIRIGINFKF